MALAPPPGDPLFEPFIRHDQYGEAGHRISFGSSLRILVLSVTLLPCRLLAAMMCVASYYILLRLLLFVPAGVLNRRLAAFWGRFWSRACLLALGFVRISRVREERRSPKLGDRPRWQVAIVSNHIGWADILIHMSRNLPSFVARDGTQDIRMIGLIRCARVVTDMRACPRASACVHRREYIACACLSRNACNPGPDAAAAAADAALYATCGV
jgi:lysophosphatidylcholine acyltransferase/lyso-PAF acetyltransferase